MKELYDFLGEIDQLSDEGSEKLDKLIKKTSELKQLPIVARKIMQVIEDPKSTAGHLEEVIKSDEALTLKILKIANSSFYGLLRKVNTLQRAILVVGFKAIKDIAVSTAILNMYRSSESISIKMWEHAVGCGIAARMLSLEFDKTETEEAFVAGLLHKIGRSLLLRAEPKTMNEILKKVDTDPGFDDLAAEEETFGFTHAQAGGMLTRNWNLSPSLEAVVRYHCHLREILWTDIDMQVKINIAIISQANKMVKHLGIGFGEANPALDYVHTPEAEFLKLTESQLNEMLEDLKLSFYEESQLFV